MNRMFLREVWRLTRPYWFSEERWAGRGLLAVIIAMSVGVVALNVMFNSWYGRFYNAMDTRDADAFWRELGIFCILAAIFILVAVYQVYLRQMLSIKWRTWLTKHYINEWLRDHAYYVLQMRGATTDNPDQRIADDIDQFIVQSLSLFLGLLESIMTLVSFSAILWGLSRGMTLPFTGVAVPGLMVWLALAYAVIGTTFTHIIGRPLIQLRYDQQRFEADFRYSMVRFRENVEGVALYRGEEDEKKVFGDRFANVIRNWWGIMRRTKRLTWLTASYGQAAVVFPIIFAAPELFRGQIQLGGVIQVSQAFGQVQSALSFFVEAYTSLAQWKATVDRLIRFTHAVDTVHDQEKQPHDIALGTTTAHALHTEHLDLALPEGRVLVRDLNLGIRQGESVLIRGPSGSGKTTLFRAIAGLWPFGRGRIERPAQRTLFLPQKPYLPMANLRTIVTYPTPPSGFSEAEIAEALSAVGLGSLVERLDEPRYWAQTLSPGEQQRIAFARAILQKPEWLFLDEATSAIDEASEGQLYRLLRQRLPHASIVSIGHRASLSEVHQREVQLGGDRPAQPAAAYAR